MFTLKGTMKNFKYKIVTVSKLVDYSKKIRCKDEKYQACEVEFYFKPDFLTIQYMQDLELYKQLNDHSFSFLFKPQETINNIFELDSIFIKQEEIKIDNRDLKHKKVTTYEKGKRQKHEFNILDDSQNFQELENQLKEIVNNELNIFDFRYYWNRKEKSYEIIHKNRFAAFIDLEKKEIHTIVNNGKGRKKDFYSWNIEKYFNNDTDNLEDLLQDMPF